jgi:Uma2 family endonuclease
MIMAIELAPPPKVGEITFEDYVELPEILDRYDIIDGVMIMSPAPSLDHQMDLSDLNDILKDFVRKHDLGLVLFAPFDLIIRKLPKLTTRQPDLAFFSWETIGGKGREALRAAKQRGVGPDLSVEILSPNQSKAYIERKLRDYAAIGIQEVWLASREAITVEVLNLVGAEYARSGHFASGQRVVSGVLPELIVEVNSIFAD